MRKIQFLEFYGWIYLNACPLKLFNLHGLYYLWYFCIITAHQQCTQHCSLHSLLHTRQPISAIMKVHNITDTSTCYMTQHYSCTPQLLHTRQTISAMLSSKMQPPTARHSGKIVQDMGCSVVSQDVVVLIV